jgi:hypothetical protein
MALVKALNGFVPSRRRGSGVNSTGNSQYRIGNAQSGNIFSGDLVKLDGGVIKAIATTTDYAVGVFQGCNYIDLLRSSRSTRTTIRVAFRLLSASLRHSS